MILLRSFQRIYHSPKFCHFKLRTILLSCPASNVKLKSFSRTCITVKSYEDKDPAPLFFDTRVQNILEKLTSLDIEKVFKNRHLEDLNVVEEYKFLTKEDLEEHLKTSLSEAKRLLQMPPVIKEREPIAEVLSQDPAIQGSYTSKFIFTDISYGISERNRLIVVREPEGTLRRATWEERDRMNRIYNPRPGRYHKLPAIFQDEYLKDVLHREEYVFLLDVACAHLEPDDPVYHRVTRDAYEHIRERSKYEVLRSTRHCGPMCFYFAWNAQIDNLLIHYIQQEKLADSAELIQLYYIIHKQERAMSEADVDAKDHLAFVKKYSEEDAVMKPRLQLALKAYQEALREREALASAVKSSHGMA